MLFLEHCGGTMAASYGCEMIKSHVTTGELIYGDQGIGPALAGAFPCGGQDRRDPR